MKYNCAFNLLSICAGVLILSGSAWAQNKTLGVGTATPNTNAALHVESPTNNQGVILPRLTTAQRTAMSLGSSDVGLMLFDITDNAIYIWNGTAWKKNDSATSPLNFPVNQTHSTSATSFTLSETSIENTNNVMSVSTAGVGSGILGENTHPDGPSTGAHGVKGVALAGGNNAGVYGTTIGGGIGVMGETTTGWSAIFGYQHNPGYGWGADVEIDAPSNTWAALFAHTSGGGPAGSFQSGNDSTTVIAKNSGTGTAGYFVRDNTDGSNPALFVKSNGAFTGNSAAIIAESDGGYAGVVSRQKSGLGNALVAQSLSPEAGSWGLYASSLNGAAGWFSSQASSEPAVHIEHTNATANQPALDVSNNGTGPTIVASNQSTTDAIAGVFRNTSGTNTYPAIQASTVSNAPGVRVYQNATSMGSGFDAVITNPSSAAIGVSVYNQGAGAAGNFVINNASNSNNALRAETNGTGPAITAYTATGWTSIQATQAGSNNAFHSENTGTGAAGFFTITSGSNNSTTLSANTQGTGSASAFQINNPGNGASAVYANTNGTGNSIQGTTSTGWSSIFAEHTGTGTALFGRSTSGVSGHFRIENSVSSANTLVTETTGTGTALQANHAGASGNIAIFQNNYTNVARIDKNGMGYFNGGTQNSGADVAEMFDVEGSKSQYEPGDVLIISESTDRTVEKSNSANSTRVAGVYATKPGVRLTERDVNESTDDLVPMGVVGVIPTKVCAENGLIKRGDLLVTSSRSGHAMKAIPVNINGVLIYPTGAILGKALENFDGNDSGLIKVLVNVK
jgi:trimeric autotransporter adhesin